MHVARLRRLGADKNMGGTVTEVGSCHLSGSQLNEYYFNVVVDTSSSSSLLLITR